MSEVNAFPSDMGGRFDVIRLMINRARRSGKVSKANIFRKKIFRIVAICRKVCYNS